MHTQLSPLLPHETMVRSTMPSAQGRAEAGAAVVAIGVGSPVARLGADGRRRREARAAVGAVGAVDADMQSENSESPVCVLGAGPGAAALGPPSLQRECECDCVSV